MPSDDTLNPGYNGVVAEYYDATYQYILASGADLEFYAALASERPGPVLELGCGTGRVLLELSRRGIECVGLDSSRAMLDKLRSKCLARAPELVWAEMQSFDLRPRRFQLIYSAFRPFQHLYSVPAQLACLRAVLAHLEPRGRFAFDVFNPRLDRLALLNEPEQGDVRFEQDGNEVIRYVTLTRDPVAQLAEARMRFETSRAGVVQKDEIELVKLRWFTRYELEHLLARAGFEDIVIYGNFDGSPVTLNSPELVVVASAP